MLGLFGLPRTRRQIVEQSFGRAHTARKVQYFHGWQIQFRSFRRFQRKAFVAARQRYDLLPPIPANAVIPLAAPDAPGSASGVSVQEVIGTAFAIAERIKRSKNILLRRITGSALTCVLPLPRASNPCSNAQTADGSRVFSIACVLDCDVSPLAFVFDQRSTVPGTIDSAMTTGRLKFLFKMRLLKAPERLTVPVVVQVPSTAQTPRIQHNLSRRLCSAC